MTQVPILISSWRQSALTEFSVAQLRVCDTQVPGVGPVAGGGGSQLRWGRAWQATYARDTILLISQGYVSRDARVIG